MIINFITFNLDFGTKPLLSDCNEANACHTQFVTFSNNTAISSCHFSIIMCRRVLFRGQGNHF